MKLIVGLGNPGEKYELTRHNLGFMVIDHFLKNIEPVEKTIWEDNKKLKGETVLFNWQVKGGSSTKIVLLKPKTFMNNSGMAVSLTASFYKIAPEDIWVVHDELDLPLGSMKIRTGGSSAGHRGVESIIEKLGTEKFWRFRLGIGEVKNHGELAKTIIHNVDEHVLGPFGRGEMGKIRELIKHGAKALAEALEKDLPFAMNRFNTK